MVIQPIQFVCMLVLLLATARIVYSVRRRRQREALQALARRWQMHFSPFDQFDLAGRVAEQLPIAGAAEVRIVDLIYGSDGRSYRYLFSAEFTVGVLQAKRRIRRVATLTEPKDPSRTSTKDRRLTLILAEPGATMVEEYEQLHGRVFNAATA